MIVGIDLGTTNSLVAVWQNGKPRLIPNALGGFLTPSCVSLDEEGAVLVGRTARDRLQSHPERTAALFKRSMGSDKLFWLADRKFRSEELSSFILRSLKADAEAFLGEPVTEAVITVPAYFSDSQRKATRIAGQLAGLKVDRLVNEPTAAAMAYGLHQSADDTQFLVFDLGGGTFDVSILELFENVMEVRATAGDNYLGGEDFVTEIVKLFMQRSGVPDAARDDAGFMQRLGAQAEAAKRRLSDVDATEVTTLWNDKPYTMELSQDAFKRACEPLLARLREPVERAMRDAKIQPDDIATVVLAGGATRSPLIRSMVTRLFGRFPSMELSPDEVVVMGAAVMAGLKMKHADLDEIVMTDVCPYTLGLETARIVGGGTLAGQFSPLIERNTVVPVSKVGTYHPTHPGQKKVNLSIYQGESRLVRDNIKLGELQIDLPPVQHPDAGIDVRFTYDVNGLLEVEATILHTKEVRRLVIQGNSGMMTEDEIAARLVVLAELKIHPRDKAENRALVARAERVYQQLRLAEREQLAAEIAGFESLLDLQDERKLRLGKQRLLQVLEFLEASNPFAHQLD